MEEKDRFDAFMRIAELRTQRATNRQAYEWRVTFGLWGAITAATIYLKDRAVPGWLGLLVIFIYGFFWLRAVYVAHYRDNETASYYIETAVAVISPGHKPEISSRRATLSRSRWLFGFLSEWGCVFQLLTTTVLIYFFYLMTNPQSLPSVLRPH